MRNWRLLLTRTEPDCQQQAAHLQSLGIMAECFPLLEIIPLSETSKQRSQLLNFDQYTTLIVVSKPAARLILERLDYYWPQLPIKQTWFTVGESSANILKEAKLTCHFPILGDNSEALWQLSAFQQNITHANTRVLIIKGQEGRQWLMTKLQQQGILAETIELYQRQQPNYPKQQLWEEITHKNINAIVVSSGQALHNLHNLTNQHWLQITKLTFIVPSDRIEEQAKQLGINQIINCKGANLQALISTLKNHQAP